MTPANQVKTNRYIFSLAFLIAILILVNGAFAYWQMNQVKQEFYEVANHDLPLAAELLPLIDRQFEQTLLIEKLHQIEDQHRAKVVHILEESFIRTGDKFATTSTNLKAMLAPMLDSERKATRLKMQRVSKLLDQIILEHQQYQNQVLTMIAEIKNGEANYPQGLIDILADEEKDLSRELVSLRDELQRFTQDSAHAVENHEALVIKGVVIFTLFVFFLGSIALIMIKKVMNARDKAFNKINFYASYDPLTSLYNRRYFFQRFNEAIDTSKNDNTPLSLCICDLDHFKQINDNLGHQAGDEILIRFGKLLSEHIREGDFAGRFGGDEFVICFPNTEAQEAIKIVERIRTLFAEQSTPATLADSLTVTSTFGLSQICATYSSDDALLEAADKALYEAKKQGRNRASIF